MPTQKIRRVNTRLMALQLDRPVGGSGVSQVDVLLTELELDSGVGGLGFSYVIGGGAEAALAAAHAIATRQLVGQPLFHPEASWQQIAAGLNRTRRGPNYIAAAALDLALWDAYAKALDVPLGVAMGGAPRAVKVYGSGGFVANQSPADASATARKHSARGLHGVTPRGTGTRGDAGLIAAVAEAIGGRAELMLDANEKCTATSAARLLAMAREAGALFVEEPLPAEDLAGLRALARTYPRLIATGEHLQGATEMLPLLAEGLVGLVQPDLAMCGLTESLRIARLAAAFGVEVSPHFLPGLFIHLAAAAPNLSWLEEFPLIEPMFEGWPELAADGTLAMRAVAGHGLRVR